MAGRQELSPPCLSAAKSGKGLGTAREADLGLGLQNCRGFNKHSEGQELQIPSRELTVNVRQEEQC